VGDVKRGFKFIFILLLLLNAFLPLLVKSSSQDNGVYLIVYGKPECEACVEAKEVLDKLGVEYEFRDLGNKSYLIEFGKIITLLNITGYIPLILYVNNSKVYAITSGISDEETIKTIVSGEAAYVVYMPLESYIVHPRILDKVAEIAHIAKGASAGQQNTSTNLGKNTGTLSGTSPISGNVTETTTTPREESIPLRTNVLYYATILALSDSINPCTMYLYILLLIAASIAFLSTKSSSKYLGVVKIGLSFIAALIIGYMLLGLGLLTLMSRIPRYILPLVGIFFGIWVILSAITGRERIVLKGKLVGILPKSAKNMLLSFGLGLLASFMLLPCSAGPYIVFLGLLTPGNWLLSFILLLYYNLVFVSPLVLILVLIVLGVSRKTIRGFIVRNHRWLSIIAGILLVIISLFLLFK